MRAVLEHIRDRSLPQESHLAESVLAKHIGTSRSPVRAVLDHLQHFGITRYDRNRGYFLAVEARQIPVSLGASVESRTDRVYLQLAHARFEGRLPSEATETEISRLLSVSRPDTHKALLRAEEEGWAQKAAGYGWEFLPTVDSLELYDDLYAVRVALEPAGILSPKFRPDRAELAKLREEQLAIAGTDPADLDPVHLFESNTRLHTAIARWSHNQVAVQILERLDRMRRLAEYRQATRPLPRAELAHEHCAILDAIEAGDMLAAASLLRSHIDGARRKKVTSTAFGPRD